MTTGSTPENANIVFTQEGDLVKLGSPAAKESIASGHCKKLWVHILREEGSTKDDCIATAAPWASKDNQWVISWSQKVSNRHQIHPAAIAKIAKVLQPLIDLQQLSQQVRDTVFVSEGENPTLVPEIINNESPTAATVAVLPPKTLSRGEFCWNKSQQTMSFCRRDGTPVEAVRVAEWNWRFIRDNGDLGVQVVYPGLLNKLEKAYIAQSN